MDGVKNYLVKGKRVGLAILCDNAPRTLSRTLASYERTGLLQFFDEICMFFINGRKEDEALAQRYGARSCLIPADEGFGGAIKQIQRVMDVDYVLVVEHDCAVWGGATAEKLQNRLSEALGVLERDAADVVRLRHSWMGQSAVSAASIYSYFYPVDQLSSRWVHAENLSDAPAWIKFLRRLRSPLRSKRWIGRSVYVEENPHLKFPNYIHKDGNLFIVDSAVFHWSNQPSIFPMDFLDKNMRRVLNYENAFTQCRTSQEFERAVNNRKWRQSHLRIGVAQGIFI